MTNHIHLILIPNDIKGLQNVLKPLHMRYAQSINKKMGWSGLLWQGRFFSSPLDEDYTWSAIRYVERNPVRANIVRLAEEYKWSSAAGHCKIKNDYLLSKNKLWNDKFNSIKDWSKWLQEGNELDKINIIRRNVYKGIPCGSNNFISKLEKSTKRILRYRPIGGQRKDINKNEG